MQKWWPEHILQIESSKYGLGCPETCLVWSFWCLKKTIIKTFTELKYLKVRYCKYKRFHKVSLGNTGPYVWMGEPKNTATSFDRDCAPVHQGLRVPHNITCAPQFTHCHHPRPQRETWVCQACITNICFTLCILISRAFLYTFIKAFTSIDHGILFKFCLLPTRLWDLWGQGLSLTPALGTKTKWLDTQETAALTSEKIKK